MSLEITTVLAIIAIAVVLFVTDKLRVDLVALLVLVSLVIAELVTPAEALSGFSNSAVITVWAMFILSGGLAQAGVAKNIGVQVLKIAGSNELRLTLVIMVTAAVLSAFMNNVGVAALLLPVVVVIARQTNIPPSRLLLPLAYGALLGGLTTLIGTPPNILTSDALRDAGLEPFGLFDFSPVGSMVLVAGIAFMLLLGRRLLPTRDPTRELTAPADKDLEEMYDIRDRLVSLKIPVISHLSGMTLQESRIGLTLGFNVIALVRNGQTILSPGPATLINERDQLLAIGSREQLDDLRGHQVDTLERVPLSHSRLRDLGIDLARLTFRPGSEFLGRTVEKSGLRSIYGLNVLAIKHEDEFIVSELRSWTLGDGDCLLVQGRTEDISRIVEKGDVTVESAEEGDLDPLDETILHVQIPEHSALVGRTLLESRLGHAFGLTVLGVQRGDQLLILPEPDERISAGDHLHVQGTTDNIQALRGLEQLEPDQLSLAIDDLETTNIGLAEVVLAPRATLAGKTLRQIHFREKYGLSVLAVWRGGQVFMTDLRDMALRFGDALLLYGDKERLRLLSSEAEFLILTEEVQAPLRADKAPIAVTIMGAVLLSVFMGWLPIAVAAILGGALMVLTGVLTMDEAHKSIEWPAVFLIAGMLPLGTAMQNSGAAEFIADGMMNLVGDLGATAILAGLFIMSVLASQVMPNAAVVVLMAPIALAAAAEAGFSPYPFMMGIAIASSASFMSPVSHPANILVMGPGGYKFGDYIKVGLPLTVAVLITVLLVLPKVWPF